ncbi:MAG: ISKra4 family transposase [Acidimicrobiales bacterium]
MNAATEDPFGPCRAALDSLVWFLEGQEAATMSHGDLEARIGLDGREVQRLALQGHLDRRAERETRIEAVVGSDNAERTSVETGHTRGLTTVFGEVTVERFAYRRRGHANLHPADAALNLPAERHSHGLSKLAAIESSRGSFDDAVDAVEVATGQKLGKRQLEGLALASAGDFAAFYETREGPRSHDKDVLVISVDGKGIVMRPEALRPATAQAAAKSERKLKTRLSKGEKLNRKRMAEIGAVYDITPARRSRYDIMPPDKERKVTPGPVARDKWLTASVVEPAASVVSQVFDEADRRDPEHLKTWVALVDGNNNQIDAIRAEAKKRNVKVHILVDFIHLLEYLWGAAWCFNSEGDPAAEEWVRDKALSVLSGQAKRVAGGISISATKRKLTKVKRANADKCIAYLRNKARYLDYATALSAGWPVATGIIEGACRHLVKDRLDITGARWGLEGAEAILKLRAIRSNGDFEEYWPYHLDQEHRRVHQARYAGTVADMAA